MNRLLALAALLLLTAVTALGDDLNALLKAEHYRKVADDTSVPTRQRIEAIDRLIKLRPAEAYRLTAEKGSLLGREGRYAEAAEVYSGLLDNEDKLPMPLRCAALHNASIALGKCNELTESVILAERLLELPKPDSLLKWDFRTYVHLHDIYLLSDDLLTATLYQEKAGETVKRMPGDTREEQTRLHGIRAATAIDGGDYDTAFAELKAMAELSPNPEVKASALAQTGQIYQAKGDNEIARYYYRKALEEMPSGANAKSTLTLLATSLYLDGDTQGVLDLVDQNRAIADVEGSSEATVQLLSLMARVYETLGDYHQAYNNVAQAIALADSVETERTMLKNRDLKTQLDERRYLAGRSSLRHRAQAMTATAAALVLIVIVLTGAVVVLWRRRRSLTAETAARGAAEQALRQQVDTLEADLAESRSSAERRMGAAALKLAQVSSALDAIRRIVASKSSTKDQRLEAIRREISGLKIQDNLWEIFSMQFEKVNQEFLHQLTERHPDLTRAEQNMCAYMVLNLSTKEIAEITHRSIRTVEAIKYTLRKKLGVTSDATEVYLRTFTPLRDKSIAR